MRGVGGADAPSAPPFPEDLQKTSFITEKISQNVFFRVEIPTQVLYLKAPKFLSPLNRLALKIEFQLANV